VDELHVYPEGPKGHRHVASMDCWCEPRLWGSIGQPHPIPVIVHSDLICVEAAAPGTTLPEFHS
jgi:hypothetical protein